MKTGVDSKEGSRASRRDFIKMAGGAAAVLGIGALAGCGSGAEEATGSSASESAGVTWDKETDVLVLGGGLAGVFAGYHAAQKGAKVILCEAAPQLGGTALLSAGSLHSWDLQTAEDVAAKMPLADPVLAKLFIETWIPLRDWLLQSSGAPVKAVDSPYPIYGRMIGMSFGASVAEKEEFFKFFTSKFETLLETRAVKLHADASNAITGAGLIDKTGKALNIGAKKVIIATGSFQANKEMVARYMGRWADQSVVRASPYCVGDGIQMALEHGAKMSKGTGHSYGHMVPWPSLMPRTIEEYEKADKGALTSLLSMVQTFSPEGIAINVNGLRYTDETSAPYAGDNYLGNETTQQPEGHAYVIIDSANASTYQARLDLLAKAGAVIETDATVEGLADKLAARGVNKSNVIKTIKEYQAAAAAGKTAELEIPKSPMQSGYLTKLNVPPFIAVQAAMGIAGFYGGLDITSKCEVKGYGAQVIPNLYAAPFAAGGIYYKEYAGALALQAAFGKIAGESAAAAAVTATKK